MDGLTLSGVAAAVDRHQAVGARRCRRVWKGAAGRGPAGAGRRGCKHGDEGASRPGAVEWRAGSTVSLPGTSSKKPALQRNLVSSEPAQFPGGVSVDGGEFVQIRVRRTPTDGIGIVNVNGIGPCGTGTPS
jgi:hypothetical protein